VNKAWVVSKDSIKCISFTVPRTKTEFFQDDLFAPTRDVEHASMTIEEWKQGQFKPLNTIDLCPEGMKPCMYKILEKGRKKKKKIKKKKK